MSAVWVALLRGINLGRRNRVPMAALRDTFESAGCESVRTYIQSGNVLFQHPAPNPAVLEAAVAEAFGVRSTVVLRSAQQFGDLVAGHPFGADTAQSFVAFLAGGPDAVRLRALLELESPPNRVALVPPDVVLRYADFHSTRLSPARLERHLGIQVTLRNWRTVARLAELAAGG